jgi:1,5-anhydro-D-fructose reductase (1,5-anhydro-D-mannitol-forming)
MENGNTQKQEIRWGIIGCGNVTEVKSGPGFQKAEYSRLTAVMRRDGLLAEDYAKRHNVPRWYDRAEALIADPEVDAVYIATPPLNHMEYTLAAAEIGKPVYVEKPMAMNAAECETMIAACRAAEVPLYVAYYRRALPRFLKVKELLDSGAIGEIRCVNTVHLSKPTPDELSGNSTSWRVNPEISGGGHFHDVASHTLDLLDFLLGPITQAQGFSTNQAGLYKAEDLVSGVYRFNSGVQGTGMWCFTAHENKEWTEISGSRGKIVFSTFAEAPVKWIHELGEESFSIAHPPHIQQPLIQLIVNDLLGMGLSPSTGLSALRTNWVMDQLTN